MPARLFRKAKKGQHSRSGSKLGLWWQQHVLGAFWNKVIRTRRQLGAPALPTKQKSKLHFHIPFPHLKFKWSWRALVLRIVGLLVVVIVVFTAVQILAVAWEPSKYSNSEVIPVEVTGDSINVLVVVYDEIDRYSFVDMLGVLSINKRSPRPLTFINVDPEYVTAILRNQPTKFRSFLATAEAEGEWGMDLLVRAMQGLLGVRVDRYVAVSRQDMQKYLKRVDINYVTTDEVSDPEAGSFDKGEIIDEDELIRYLAADSEGVEAKLVRMTSFAEYYLSSLFSINGYIQLFLNLDQFSTTINTNMTKSEMLDLALNLLNRPGLNKATIGPREGRFIQAKLGGYYVADVIALDTKLQSVLAREGVLKEQARIEVYNATQISGKATSYKRLLANQGANVIRAGNSPELSERTKLYVGKNSVLPANISLITEMLRDEVLIIEEDYPLNHTGDLVLILGADAP